MKQKVWQTTYQDIDILVKNAWNFKGDTQEEIWINGERVHYFNNNESNITLKRYFGFCRDFYVNDIKITVKVGSVWHLCGMACQILINDKYHDGDKIVLFASKISKETP